MTNRGLDKVFLDAMRSKLQQGRENGYVGWDEHWEGTIWSTNDPIGYLLDLLNHEVLELDRAINTGTKEEVKFEAADVANYAMLIADYIGGLSVEKKDE